MCVIFSRIVQEMVSKLSVKMSADGLTDLTNHATMFRDDKRQAEERIAAAKANASNVQATQRANKKKSAKKKKVGLWIFRCRVQRIVLLQQ